MKGMEKIREKRKEILETKPKEKKERKEI